MKKSTLAMTLLVLLVLGSRELWAQAYGSYYYGPYWNGLLYQQYYPYDPYYELHVMHYQLYLPSHQTYPIYYPCCYAWGVAIPRWSTPVVVLPQPVITSQTQMIRQRTPGVVGPLPRAVGPLPQATSGK
jgi:hypothetical protein